MDNATSKTINPETGTVYSRAELKAAFDKVCNSQNWKMPIDAVITEAERDVATQAVIFFAGCSPKFRGIGPAKLRMTAVGYYKAVGA
jgi:hypothetical protein